MARLIFFDETHTYTVDGEEFPSVSEISRFASREIYGDVMQYNLDRAASRGSAVHKSTEVLDKYGKVECDEDIEPYVRAYVKFRKDFCIKDYAHIEKALAHEPLKYAGTIDRIYNIDEAFVSALEQNCKHIYFVAEDGSVQKKKIEDCGGIVGKLAIVDLKSSSVVQHLLAIIQLNAYKMLTEENGLGEVGVLLILHLDKEGEYKLTAYEINEKIFAACLTLHKALTKKKKAKKEKTENE